MGFLGANVHALTLYVYAFSSLKSLRKEKEKEKKKCASICNWMLPQVTIFHETVVHRVTYSGAYGQFES